MADTVMIQDSVNICPQCKGGLRKIITQQDIIYVCGQCSIALKVIDKGQSERELKCEVIR